jgi:hypothetical protein
MCAVLPCQDKTAEPFPTFCGNVCDFGCERLHLIRLVR